MNKNYIFWIVIAAVALWGGYHFFFSNNDSSYSPTQEEQKEVSSTELRANELAQQYGAITGWENDLVYTIQAQERLVSDKPVLFQGYLDDVFNRNGKTYIRFMSSYSSPVDYVLELQCDRSIVDKFIKQPADEDRSFLKYFDEFAVVANIDEVSKPAFALTGTAYAEDDVEIEVDSSNLFTATGTCVDIVEVGNLFDE